MTRRPHRHPPAPSYDLVRLVKGPLHNRRVRVLRQPDAQIHLRAPDGQRTAVYCGNTQSGELHHQRTYDRGRQNPRRRGRTGGPA